MGSNEGTAKAKKLVTGPPPRDPNKQYVNPDEEDQMEIQGYCPSTWRSVITGICVTLTAGLLLLVFYWLPRKFLQCTHVQCSLAEATSVLLKDQYQQWFVARVKTITKDGTRVEVVKPSARFFTSKSRRHRTHLLLHSSQRDENLIRYFGVKRVKYLWDPEEDRYLKLRGLEYNNTCSYFHEAKGLNAAHQIKRYGLWRTLTGKHHTLEFSLMEAGHTKFHPDWHFGLWKVKWRSTSAETLEEVAASVRSSSRNNHNIPQLVDDAEAPVEFWDWKSFFKQFFKPLPNLTSYHHFRRVLYGINAIEVHVAPILMLLFKEGLSPFYVFQVFSCCVWYADEYYYYATCIIVISAISLSTTIYQTRKMQRALRNTIQTSTVVSVCRGGDEYQDLSSEDLVPGDVIEIPHHGCVMQCDAVLISGNCIVNESMLTGESVPVTKTPVPNTSSSGGSPLMFSLKEHARHVLFCGTHVIQTRYYGKQKVRAVVIRTGFQTLKGELVRSIMYPKPVDFKFNKETYFYVGILAMIAGVGFIYTIVLMVHRGDTFGLVMRRSLDLITIAVPPALPAALTVGIVFAQRRLKRSQIYCISPRSINVCGSINAVCFDKTGTLTEDGLNMQGVVPVENQEFKDEITNMLLMRPGPMLDAMATCHSLTIIDNELNGDPLDLIMFQALNWDLVEAGEESSRFDMLVPTIVRPKPSSTGTSSNFRDSGDSQSSQMTGEDIGIVRQFPFSSSLQRMSVITRKLASPNFNLFVKGSPEMITSLCKPESVPEDFLTVLKSYTQHGYRVIGLAWRPLPAKYNYVKIQRAHRDHLEKDLTFLGLLVLENKLKPETTPTIEKLMEANIRTVMVTGDNMLTALSVAHECKMVNQLDRIILVEASMGPGSLGLPQVQFIYEENKSMSVEEIHLQKNDLVTQIQIDDDRSKFHFATTGRSWAILRQHFPDILAKVLVRGVVFARMSPEQKAQLVESLQEMGYYVGMCGDGANDCGALKMAHTGISLSEAEASVASPFTSKNANIECVPTVVREGRAALVTSFGIFKYMACYSLTQFVSVLILYKVQSNLTDFEFLYIDLFLLTSLSVTYGRTEAYSALVKDPPQLSLMSLGPILSLMMQMAIQISAQVFCFFHVQQQPWFVPHVPEEEDDNVSYENTAIFSISAFQYIILAVALSKGAPYRKNIFSNYLFLVNIVICLGMTIWITVYPLDAFVDFFELKPSPSIPYRLVFFGVAAINCLLSIILETFLLDHAVFRRKFQSLRERCCPSLKFQYTTVEEEIVNTPGWPPLGSVSGVFPMDSYSPDEFSKETDRMLDSSFDNKRSSLCSSPTTGASPRTSTLDYPYFTGSADISTTTHSLSVEGIPETVEPASSEQLVGEEDKFSLCDKSPHPVHTC